MKTISVNKITDFLGEYCTKVKKNERFSYVELMMDNHRCVEYQSVKYYIPETNSLMTVEEYDVHSFLIDNYLI